MPFLGHVFFMLRYISRYLIPRHSCYEMRDTQREKSDGVTAFFARPSFSHVPCLLDMPYRSLSKLLASS